MENMNRHSIVTLYAFNQIFLFQSLDIHFLSFHHHINVFWLHVENLLPILNVIGTLHFESTLQALKLCLF